MKPSNKVRPLDIWDAIAVLILAAIIWGMAWVFTGVVMDLCRYFDRA